MARIWLSLGSNLGNREQTLRDGVAGLAPAIVVDAVSGLWETAPLYVTEQPAFLNLALAATTALSPPALLAHLKSLEQCAGRAPAGVRYGPRPLDLDILFYDAEVWETDELTIPHPRLAERGFVLYPLAEIAPEVCHPVSGETIQVLLGRLAQHSGSQSCVRIGRLK